MIDDRRRDIILNRCMCEFVIQLRE